MTGELLTLVMLAASFQTAGAVRALPEDTTQPQGQVRRLGDSEVATYVVNHGVYPAGIMGEVGESFGPDGTAYGGGRIPRQGSFRIDDGKLCVSFYGHERCRFLYADEVGVVFSSILNPDRTEGPMSALDPNRLETGR